MLLLSVNLADCFPRKQRQHAYPSRTIQATCHDSNDWMPHPHTSRRRMRSKTTSNSRLIASLKMSLFCAFVLCVAVCARVDGLVPRCVLTCTCHKTTAIDAEDLQPISVSWWIHFCSMWLIAAVTCFHGSSLETLQLIYFVPPAPILRRS